MNFYQFHIGDFRSATRHLSTLERAYYREAIDYYYDTENPIDANNIDQLERHLLCKTDEEKAALHVILDEFFENRDGFFHHERCDHEIEKYHAHIESSSRGGKNSATKRKRKMKSNATPLQHPLKSTSTPLQVDFKGTTESLPSERQATNNQLPITNNQKKIKDTVGQKPPDVGKSFETEKRILAKLNEKTGGRFKPLGVNLDLIRARLDEGYTEGDCCEVIERKCADWLDDEKMREYLRPATLFGRQKFSQYAGLSGDELVFVNGERLAKSEFLKFQPATDETAARWQRHVRRNGAWCIENQDGHCWIDPDHPENVSESNDAGEIHATADVR